MRIGVLVVFAVIWTVFAYFLPPLGIMAFYACILCALLDIGMNGAADAEFVPINMAGAGLALIGSSLGAPA